MYWAKRVGQDNWLIIFWINVYIPIITISICLEDRISNVSTFIFIIQYTLCFGVSHNLDNITELETTAFKCEFLASLKNMFHSPIIVKTKYLVGKWHFTFVSMIDFVRFYGLHLWNFALRLICLLILLFFSKLSFNIVWFVTQLNQTFIPQLLLFCLRFK